MDSNVLSQVPGGTLYATVYPAGWDQNSSAGTQDIINHIASKLASNPNECFILNGWSQGAAATTHALSSLTGAAFNAVKAVFLIGNPIHKAGLACNVDNNGGNTTRDVNGLSSNQPRIPDNWLSKTLDVCIYVLWCLVWGVCLPDPLGDGVCDTKHGFGINLQHLEYPFDAATQKLGTKFAVGKLQGAS